MSGQIDIRKLENVLAKHEQKISALATALDAANARYCSLAAFVLALPASAEIDRQRALEKLGVIRIRKLGSGHVRPGDVALDELESLLSRATSDQSPQDTAA